MQLNLDNLLFSYNLFFYLSRLGTRTAGVSEVKGHAFFKEINFLDIFKKKVVPPYIPDNDNIDLKNLKSNGVYKTKLSGHDD